MKKKCPAETKTQENNTKHKQLKTPETQTPKEQPTTKLVT